MDRREFIRRAVVSSTLIATGVIAFSEVLSKLGSAGAPDVLTSGTGTQTQQVSAPAGYVFVAPMSSLQGKVSAYFTHPTQGTSILVNTGGSWKAFSATCTHQPCTVGFSGGQSISCPCHGATFSTANGSVLSGPAPLRLAEFGVLEQAGGLYVTTSRIN